WAFPLDHLARLDQHFRSGLGFVVAQVVGLGQSVPRHLWPLCRVHSRAEARGVSTPELHVLGDAERESALRERTAGHREACLHITMVWTRRQTRDEQTACPGVGWHRQDRAERDWR